MPGSSSIPSSNTEDLNCRRSGIALYARGLENVKLSDVLTESRASTIFFKSCSNANLTTSLSLRGIVIPSIVGNSPFLKIISFKLKKVESTMPISAVIAVR